MTKIRWYVRGTGGQKGAATRRNDRSITSELQWTAHPLSKMNHQAKEQDGLRGLNYISSSVIQKSTKVYRKTL